MQLQENPEPDHTVQSALRRVPALDRAGHTALRPMVARALITAIVKGELRAGDWLNVQKLAQDLEVSATPVREALVELVAIGMVDMLHNRGTMVREFGPVQMRDIFHVRAILEAEATRCACGHITTADLKNFKVEMTELLESRFGAESNWPARAMNSDRGLHRTIAIHSGNQRLAEEIGRYDGLIQCIRDVVGNRSSAQQQALEEHLEIIHLLLKRRADAAAAAMSRHIFSTANTVRTALFRGRSGRA